jgi:hypothetical protein
VGGLGALIAFAHGVPNNAPRILHKTTRRWVALFPGRVTAGVREQFGNSHGPEFIAARLRKMRQTKLASGPWLQQASPDAQSLMLVTAALARGPRTDEAIARRTGLTILDVRRWVAEAGRLDWIDAARRLTDRGQSELAHARRRTGAMPAGKKTLTADAKDPYYPQSLRAPLAV